jgi:Uma2 family endonuclease
MGYAAEVLDQAAPEPPYGRRMSVQAWAQMDEDVTGELVDGRLEEEEVPDSPHEVVVSVLLRVLFGWAHLHRGLVLPSETKYALGEGNGRKADISVFFTRQHKLPRRGALTRPPDIAVEVASRRPRDHRRDRIDKLRDYAVFGVAWYWLVDPEARSLEVLRLGDDGHYIHTLDAATGVVTVPGCEGLTLDLDALWQELDELVEEDGPESA